MIKLKLEISEDVFREILFKETLFLVKDFSGIIMS